jgi:hypothetical protein
MFCKIRRDQLPRLDYSSEVGMRQESRRHCPRRNCPMPGCLSLPITRMRESFSFAVRPDRTTGRVAPFAFRLRHTGTHVRSWHGMKDDHRIRLHPPCAEWVGSRWEYWNSQLCPASKKNFGFPWSRRLTPCWSGRRSPVSVLLDAAVRWTARCAASGTELQL